MRKLLCILMFLMCILTWSGALEAYTPPRPPKPNKTAYTNALNHFNHWRYQTLPQAEKNVEKAFKAAMELVNDFKNANASIRATMYPALPASIKDKVVSAVSSALSLAVSMATEMVKAMTLEGAASTVFGNHTTKLDTFNDYWDGRGTVTESDTLALMQAELNQHGKIGIQASSVMGAFHRLEYAAGVYNLQVQAWNAWYKKYAPSQYDTEKEDELTIQDPIKPGFTTIGCFNHCGYTFDTFTSAESSHKEECGTAKNVDIEAVERGSYVYDTLTGQMVRLPMSKASILGSRSTAQGCGRYYYDCPNKPAGTEHKEQTCTIWVWEKPSGNLNAFKSYQCGYKFRECMGHTRDHNPYDLNPLEATHSASGDSSTDDWDSSDDSDDDDDDTEQDTQGLQTEQTQTPTPSYHACGVHETSVSGDHSAAGCGVSGHYVCDGSDHTLQASCSVTNSNGDYCTYASFYACQSHTHVYPAPTPSATCARKACGQTVSHRLAHRIDCDNCDNHYWTCIEGATHNHTTPFTCRRSGCGVTFTKCSNGVCPESSAGNYHWAAD